tara:strand:+ start:369 stop:512 length:144 start_codon:yes stop_codon:yes gene_type:complete
MGLLEQLNKNISVNSTHLEFIADELYLMRKEFGEAMDKWENENQGDE